MYRQQLCVKAGIREVTTSGVHGVDVSSRKRQSICDLKWSTEGNTPLVPLLFRLAKGFSFLNSDISSKFPNSNNLIYQPASLLFVPPEVYLGFNLYAESEYQCFNDPMHLSD